MKLTKTKTKIRRKLKTRFKGGGFLNIKQDPGQKSYSYISLSITDNMYGKLEAPKLPPPDFESLIDYVNPIFKGELKEISVNAYDKNTKIIPHSIFSITPSIRLKIMVVDNKNTYVRLGDSIASVNFYSGSGLFYGFKSISVLIESLNVDKFEIDTSIFKLDNIIEDIFKSYSSLNENKKSCDVPQNTPANNVTSNVNTHANNVTYTFNVKSDKYGESTLKLIGGDNATKFVEASGTDSMPFSILKNKSVWSYKVCKKKVVIDLETLKKINNSIFIFGAGPVGLVTYIKMCELYPTKFIYLFEKRNINEPKSLSDCIELTRENIAFLGFNETLRGKFGAKMMGKINKNQKTTHTHHKNINHITNKLLIPGELTTFMSMSEIQKILLEHIDDINDSKYNNKHHIIFTGFDVSELGGEDNLIIDCTGNRDENISFKFSNEETFDEETFNEDKLSKLSKLVGTTDIQVKKKTETATELELQYKYKFNYLLYICKTNLNKKFNKKCSRVILKTSSTVTSAQARDGGIDWKLELEDVEEA
jgi:hypothetical protein